ncbi:helix-turn-helix domain-containing protein [Qipengyuania sp. SM2507]
MAETSFGQSLGDLIRRKRKAAGLTQLQLSEDAYETPSKVRRISELETGKVPNPHSATVDPIILTLKISDEELERCAGSFDQSRPSDLNDAFHNARNLIEALARQFEHDNPDAELGELDSFLRTKSKEWRELKSKIKSLESDDAKVDAAKQKAEEALSNGEFDDVDRYLQEAEEFHQQSKTIDAIRKQSEIRIARGDALLLKGDADSALAAFEKAADFFAPFDANLQALSLGTTAWRIYEVSLRSVPGRFDVSASLLRRLLKLEIVASDPLEKSKTAYRLGLVLRNLADRTETGRSKEIIYEATSFARDALAGAKAVGDPFQQVSSAVNLANCLMAVGRNNKDVEPIEEAIRVLQEFKKICAEDDNASQLLQHVANSLGSSLLYKAGLVNAEDIYDQAMHNFMLAVSASEENLDIEVWGGAKANVARLLRRKAQMRSEDAYESSFLRIRAISEYQAALETYPETIFSDRFADIQFEIAGLFFHHAQSCDDRLTELYFMRSLNAYAAAGYIHTRDVNPRRWAEINLYTASVFAVHAEKFDHAREPDIEEALVRYREAGEVFKMIGASEFLQVCEEAIARLHELREGKL